MADFPVAVYDRPGLAVSNLARLDIPAAFQSMFDPEGLSPNQMEHFRKRILGGKEPKNPILKTAWDLATNPVMWIGLAMALHPVYGRVGKANELREMFKAGNRIIRDVPIWLRYVSSPLTGYRALHHKGFWTWINKYLDDTASFTTEFSDKFKNIMEWYTTTAGAPLTRRQVVAVGAALDGFGDAAQSAKLFGFSSARGQAVLKGGPLIENLTEKLKAENEHLPELVKRMRSLFEEMGKKLFEGAKTGITEEGIRRDLFAKGVDIIEHYFPHLTTRTSPEAWISRVGGLTQKMYQKALHHIAGGYTGPFLKARYDKALPLMSDLEQIKDWFKPEVFNRFKQVEGEHIQTAKEVLYKLIRHGQWHDQKLVEAGINKFDPAILSKLEKIGGYRAFIERLSMELGAIANATDPAAMEAMISEMGTILGAPVRYSLDFKAITPKYISGTATTYGWITKGTGKILDSIVATIPSTLVQGPAGTKGSLNWIINDWQTELAPMLRGFKHPKEWMLHRTWLDMNEKFAAWLVGGGKLQKMIPEKTKAWLLEGLSGARGSFSEKTLGGKIASMYYASTLGMNISPAAKNLMQPFLTTINVAGPRAMLAGMEDVGRRMPRFLEIAAKEGVEEATKKVFKEYYAAFGSEGIAQAMASGDITKEGMASAIASATSSVYTKVMKGIMLPFSMSEKTNRLWSFYSFLNQAVQEGIPLHEAGQWARDMVRYTQFTGGVIGQPKILRGMWTPLRQYAHFPLRYLEFLAGSVRMGPNPDIPSLGILGRSLIGSTALYTAGKNLLGLDLSGSLMAEALPKPSFESGAFYPFPFIPPFVGSIGSVMKAAYGGTTEPLWDVLKMHVPGGLAISRSYRSLAPKYADYNHRTPDGRIPLYNDKGMLVASLTPMQLAMRAMGLQEAGQEAERQMTRYLLRHREEIREFRRRYLEAVANNELELAERINKQFTRKYPQLGDLKVKKSDIKAVNDRRNQARIERIMKGFRVEDREMFRAILDQSVIGQMAQRLDEDPTARSLLEAQFTLM